MNATSSHDTKRGEDARARLNVLSELAEEFNANLGEWRRINAPRKRQIKGAAAPDGSEELYLYQTLLGSYPFEPSTNFAERIKLHMVKSLREAKINTSWLAPNSLYEDTVTNFAQQILSSKDFVDAFMPFQQKIAYYGAVNSLAQTLLKITCPGVPDFYQGTELWDLNLVDPDNRRSVDFQLRKKLLTETAQLQPDKAPELFQRFETRKAKLYVIHKALQFRRQHRQLFEKGQYLPLTAEGSLAGNVVAFLRKNGSEFALTVVPRFTVSLPNIEEGSAGSNRNRTIPPLNKGWGGTSEIGRYHSKLSWSPDWLDTCIRLPEHVPKSWRDVFTGKDLYSLSNKLLLNDVLGSFPVALLGGGGSE